MPYIKKEERQAFDDMLKYNLSKIDLTPGQLNYIMTKLIKTYIEKKGLKYSTIAEISGVLSNVESEFYRRVAIPYENEKIEENGDVY